MQVQTAGMQSRQSMASMLQSIMPLIVQMQQQLLG